MVKHSKEVNVSRSGELKAADGQNIGFNPRIASQIRLFPSRSIKQSFVEYTNGKIKVIISANKPGELPSGKIPRLLLLWLASEIQQNSDSVDRATRTVYAGSSFRGFIERLGMSYGSSTRQRVLNQLQRFASVTFDFQIATGSRVKSVHADRFLVAEAYNITFPRGEVQDDSLFPNFITLSERMWDELKNYPVPVDLNMIAKLGKSTLALDVYLWVTYRVNELHHPAHLTWQQLHDQFNAGESASMTLFRQRFRSAVADVVRVYPDLNIDVSSSKQMVLYPSVPSILTREMRGKGKPALTAAAKVSSRVRGDAWFTVATEYGRGRVFGSLQRFSTVQAQQHLCGVVPLDKACPVCAYSDRNVSGHGSAEGGPV